MRGRRFSQVDVFSVVPYRGNPVAVVLDAEGLDPQVMQRFARFAGHPTLGSCHAATPGWMPAACRAALT